MEDNCRFCFSLSSFEDKLLAQPFNTILLESDHFMALPSLGSLIEGWVLIVPKCHYICTGAMSEALLDEISLFTNAVKHEVGNRYGKSVVFEHGPLAHNQSIGCSVDHAHLHVVPMQSELRQLTSSLISEGLEWVPVEGLIAAKHYHEQGRQYVYLEESTGGKFICSHPAFPSQLLRKAIAQQTGNPNTWNWRTHPYLDNVDRTVNAFTRAH